MLQTSRSRSSRDTAPREPQVKCKQRRPKCCHHSVGRVLSPLYAISPLVMAPAKQSSLKPRRPSFGIVFDDPVEAAHQPHMHLQ